MRWTCLTWFVVLTACGASSAEPEASSESGGTNEVGGSNEGGGAGAGGNAGAATPGGAGSPGSAGSATSGMGGAGGAGNASSRWVAVDHNHQAIWMKAAPNVNRIYMSERVEKRLYVTEDSGATWTPLANKTIDGKAVDAHFLEMVFDPTDPADNTFWVTGMYGAVGVYYTKDGGKTFSSTCFQHMETSSVDLTDPARSTILGSTHGADLILSTDGGKTCASILGVLQAADPNIKSANSPLIVDSQTFLVAVGGYGGTDGVFRSIDAGKTWAKVATQAPCQPIIVGPDGTYVYALFWNRGIIFSQDQGKTWAQGVGYGKLDYGLGEGRSGSFLADGRLVFIRMLTKSGDQQLMVSSDYKTFTNFLDPFPVTQLDSPDQTLGVVYSKPGNKLYTYTRYGKISRWDL